MDQLPWGDILKTGPSAGVIIVLCYLLVTRDKQVEELKNTIQRLVTAIEVQNVRCEGIMHRILGCVQGKKDGGA